MRTWKNGRHEDICLCRDTFYFDMNDYFLLISVKRAIIWCCKMVKKGQNFQGGWTIYRHNSPGAPCHQSRLSIYILPRRIGKIPQTMCKKAGTYASTFLFAGSLPSVKAAIRSSVPKCLQRLPRFLCRLCHDVHKENTALSSSYYLYIIYSRRV